MTFWARDFSQTALPNGNVPSPLNLTGFHNSDDFSQIIFYNNNGENPTLWMGNLVPIPALNITPLTPGSNLVWWLTSDATYTNVLQSSTNAASASGWQSMTNTPSISGVTNSIAVPATNRAGFYRLLVP